MIMTKYLLYMKEIVIFVEARLMVGYLLNFALIEILKMSHFVHLLTHQFCQSDGVNIHMPPTSMDKLKVFIEFV